MPCSCTLIYKQLLAEEASKLVASSCCLIVSFSLTVKPIFSQHLFTTSQNVIIFRRFIIAMSTISSTLWMRDMTMNHCDWPTDKSGVPAFGDPLLSEPNLTRYSDCPNYWIQRAFSFETNSLDTKDPSGFSFRELIAGLCKSAGISQCRYSYQCLEKRKQLDRVLPRCRWKNFRDWVLETLACCRVHNTFVNLPEPIFYCPESQGARSNPTRR